MSSDPHISRLDVYMDLSEMMGNQFTERAKQSTLPTLKEKEKALIEQWVNVQDGKLVFESREEKARDLTYGIVKSMFDSWDHEFTSSEQLFIIWSCKTLQNWKMILSAHFEGFPFVKVTYNGNKKETYIDVYRKLESVRIPD